MSKPIQIDYAALSTIKRPKKLPDVTAVVVKVKTSPKVGSSQLTVTYKLADNDLNLGQKQTLVIENADDALLDSLESDDNNRVLSEIIALSSLK